MKINESAIEKLKDLLQEEQTADLKIRVYVEGGGCSGFQYGFSFDTEQNEDDFEFVYDDVVVLVDSMSYQYLNSAEISYRDDLVNGGFAINNPQATTTCGCGSSFSI